MQGDKYEPIWIVLHANNQFDQLEDAIIFILRIYSFFIKVGIHEYINLCLGLQFDSINQYICFCVKTMTVLLL